MKFAENLKKIRKLRGYSQKRLAEAMGVVQGCIANWEAGTRQPKVSDLSALAGVLKVATSALTGISVPDSLALYGNSTESAEKRPLFTSLISAGFPSPADDYVEKRLDLNDLVIKNRTATFFVKVSGDSMIDAGINDGDTLVVDRSITPTNNSIVIAVVGGELTVKRMRKSRKKIVLLAANKDYPDIEVTEEMELYIWGVVTNVIHPV